MGHRQESPVAEVTMKEILYGLCFLYAIMTLVSVAAGNCHFHAISMAVVSESTIGVEMITEGFSKTRGGEITKYDLQAFVNWSRPSGRGYDDFEVWLGFGNPKQGCDALEDGVLTNNKTTHTFHGLYHGYTYYFQVRTHDTQNGWYALGVSRTHFITPDCFRETNNATYCSKRSIETVSAPPLLLVSEVIAERSFEDDHVTAMIEWSRPLQENGSFYEFILSYKRQKESDAGWQNVYLPLGDPMLINGTDAEYGYLQPGLLTNDTYNIKVRGQTTKGGELIPGLSETLITALMNVTLIRNPPVPEETDDGNEIGRSGRELFEPTPGLTTGSNPVATFESWQIWTAIVVASFGVFAVLACCLRCMVRRHKEAARAEELLSDMNTQKVHHISGSLGEIKEVTRTPDIVFKNREFDRSMLKLDRELGSGQFGIVYKAYAFGVNGAKEFVPVAVKCLKETADLAMKEDFLDEIRLLIEIDDHPNILSVLGCCTVEEPYYLITEYMRYGDLLRFLWKSREERYRVQDAVYNINQQNRLQIARQIARGMEYLSKTRYYHGDLAARNILVGENLVVKISDFGLADDIYQAGYKRLAPDKKRPVKWVSLETNTTGKCTIQSDVWSYGIVLYEVYTSGGVPYPGISGRELIQKLQDGYRMDRPEECPDEIYEVMLSCWQANPSDRPNFNTVYRIMDCLLAERSDYLATDEEKSAHRILPLIKKTSSSSTSIDKGAPAVPERPRETLGEDSEEEVWGAREAPEDPVGHANGSYEPEEEEVSDMEKSSLDTLLEPDSEQPMETKL